MRVNIVGKGVCPVLGVILPVINTEVSEGVLVTILKTRNIRVFDTISGVQITLRNYKNFLMRRTVAAVAQTAAPIEPVKVPATKVEKKKKSTKKQADEAPATVDADAAGDYKFIHNYICSDDIVTHMPCWCLKYRKIQLIQHQKQPMKQQIHQLILIQRSQPIITHQRRRKESNMEAGISRLLLLIV